MNQEFPPTAPEPAPHPVHPAASERVGVPEVDAVLEEIESVGELPVSEQVAVFERAHERLRHALDAPAQDADDATTGPLSGEG